MLDGMAYRVRFTDDPNGVLDRAGSFLASRPVEHNLIVSLLDARVARPAPGRYWIAEQDDEVVGVVFQSPTTYTASVTPMPPAAVDAAVAAIVEQGVTLPAVNGDAATSARFAGSWAERTQCPV